MRVMTSVDRGAPGALAGALAAGGWAELALGADGGDPLAYAWVALTTLPLAACRRAPVVAGLGVQVALLVGTPVVTAPPLLAQGVAVFLVATYVAGLGARGWPESVVVGLASAALLALQGVLDPVSGVVGAVVANVIYVTMSWAVAAAVRLRVQEASRSVEVAEATVKASRERTELAVREERERLSRELHDVLGHSISVMVVRARGGVHEHAVDPEQALTALREVAEVGSRALADVRLLMQLDQESGGPDGRDPQPRVGDIAALVRRTSGGGAEVGLRVQGQPTVVSDGLGLAAYRVVQESITNVLRHSGSRRAEVVITWTATDLVVAVDDEGPARPQGGGGRGLIGMRERVTLVGGDLRAGPRADGGFSVEARFPLGARP